MQQNQQILRIYSYLPKKSSMKTFILHQEYIKPRFERIILPNMFVSSHTFVPGSFNPCQASVAFYIEPSHLTYTANPMFNFYMKFNTGLKRI